MRISGEAWKGSGRGTERIDIQCQVLSLNILVDGHRVQLSVSDTGLEASIDKVSQGGITLVGKYIHELKPMLFTANKEVHP